MKLISTGGLGDSFIVFLKIAGETTGPVEWLHVESNDLIEKSCRSLYDGPDSFFGKHLEGVTFKFECDPNYITNYYKGRWADYTPVSSGHDKKCPLKGMTQFESKNPFISRNNESLISSRRESSIYDVCIQVSGGAKNSRRWLFDPIILKNVLKQKGWRVCLIGSDEKYFDLKDNDNFVGKFSLDSSLLKIEESSYFIGLSGFLNYYACAVDTSNAHLVESEEHDKRYYHPDWRSDKLMVGSLSEVLKLLEGIL